MELELKSVELSVSAYNSAILETKLIYDFDFNCNIYRHIFAYYQYQCKIGHLITN